MSLNLETDPHFHRYYHEWNRRGLILCALGVPLGIALDQPVVWVLGLIGMCVTSWRLMRS